MRRAASLAIIWAAALMAPAALSQDYPARPVTIIVPFPAGGPTDVLARIIAQPVSTTLKQQVIVDNVGGASGTVGAARAARSAPDGYTVFLHNVSHATASALYKSLPYDPVADFEPIGLVAEVPQALVGRKNLPAATLPELVDYLKTKRQKVNIAQAGRGSGSQLCALVLMSELDTKLTEVAYRGTGPAITDLMGDQVDVMCDQISNTGPQITSGTIKGFCVASKRRVAALADLPACSEAGLSGFTASVWHGLYAPKSTPPAILKTIGDALRAALRDPNVKARLAELGTEPEPEARVTPDALREQLKSEIGKWSTIIKSAGLKPE